MFRQIISNLKLFLLFLFNIFRKALCCFSRRRKLSNSSETLLFVNVIDPSNSSDNNSYNSISISPSKMKGSERDWNSWDDAPRTVEEHIEQYRQKLKPSTQTETEPEPDYFQDMTPKIKSQTQVYVGPKMEENTDFSCLKANNTDVPIPTTGELEDWNEDDFNSNGGWDDEIDPDHVKKLIREQRRAQRQQRHQFGQNTKGNSNKQHFAAERLNQAPQYS